MRLNTRFSNPLLFAQIALASWLATCCPAWAFDASKVADGLYYNGTNVDDQLWTPLMLVRQGQLMDPFAFVGKNGVKALEGRGQTTMLEAVTPFLYGGCTTQAKLASKPPLVAQVPTVYVSAFDGKGCPLQQRVAFENYRLPRDRRHDNPFPTLYLDQVDTGTGMLWAYGVPGKLVGNQQIPVNAYNESQIGAKPWPVNGVVSRMSFIPLPVIEPDLTDIALAEKKPLPKYPVSLSEAVHRGDKVTVSAELLAHAQSILKSRLWDRYYPQLAKSLQGKFGGIKKSYFELGLIQGVDLDNRTSFDYAGVARIGVETHAGPQRWVDVIYVWRKKDDSLSIIATSEEVLYSESNRFFSETRPIPVAPAMVISGFSDFDKDKQLEVVVSVIRVVGNIVFVRGAPGSIPLELRQNFLYAWEQPLAGPLQWRPVYQTLEHEAHILGFDPKDIRIDSFGK